VFSKALAHMVLPPGTMPPFDNVKSVIKCTCTQFILYTKTLYANLPSLTLIYYMLHPSCV